jgi:hypothetical protein
MAPITVKPYRQWCFRFMRENPLEHTTHAFTRLSSSQSTSKSSSLPLRRAFLAFLPPPAPPSLCSRRFLGLLIEFLPGVVAEESRARPPVSDREYVVLGTLDAGLTG